jgi:hypothetical protein
MNAASVIRVVFCMLTTAQEPRVVQLVSHPFLGNDVLRAGPAQFGLNLKGHQGVSFFTLIVRYSRCKLNSVFLL